VRVHVREGSLSPLSREARKKIGLRAFFMKKIHMVPISKC
jgi:hypothetical protein